MPLSRRRAFGAALALLAAGCAEYRPKPLEPSSEMAHLRGRGLEGFVVERWISGSGPPPASFDPSDGLDEAEVVAVALARNPDLVAKRLEAGEARALLIAAGRWPNPELGGTWRTGAGGHALEADLLFDLLQPWERGARKGIAAARVGEVEAGILAEEWNLVADARRQRAQVRFAEQSLALFREEVALRERMLALVRRRRELGEATEMDISAAELETAEVRQEGRRLEGEFESARRGLNRVLGLPPGYGLRLSDSGKPLAITLFDEPGEPEIDRRILAWRSELRAQARAYEKAEHELRLAVQRQFPRPRIGPSFSREGEGGRSAGLAASVEIPLFDRNQAEIAEKENQRERARAAYVALLHRLRADAFEAAGRFREARREVEMQEKESLPLVKRSQALFEKAFQSRELRVLEWTAERQRTLRARQAYVAALFRYQEAVIRLEAATGGPLSASPGSGPAKENGGDPAPRPERSLP